MEFIKKHCFILCLICILLEIGFLFRGEFLEIFRSFVLWRDGMLIDFVNLILSFFTVLGVVGAFLRYRKNSERQEKIDLNSVSIKVSRGNAGLRGIFEVTNYGEIPHRVKIEKAVLNDGSVTPIIFEEDDPKYSDVFCGEIKLGQIFEIHLFNICTEDVFVFRGGIRITVDEKVITLVKVRYSGSAAEKIQDSFDVHPIGRWVIYSQEELKE